MTVCSGTLEHVELALLEGSELASAVQAHLSSCSSCATQAETLKGIVLALQASPAPKAPAGLTARIVPLVLAEAQKGRRQGVFVRVMRPVAAFATAFGMVLATLAAAGGALIVSAAISAAIPKAPQSATPVATPTVAPSTAPATATPVTPAPTTAPATEAPSESAVPAATPTPEPADVPRRTPDPVSPDPSEGESTAPTESTSP